MTLAAGGGAWPRPPVAASGEEPRRLEAPLPAAAIVALRVELLVHHLVPFAQRLGIRFALLKGAALHLLGLVAADERPLSDLDVLLAPEAAVRLHAALRAEGFTAPDYPAEKHHLTPLHHPAWPPLELHVCLPGVTLDGTGWATFAQLEEAGALEPYPVAGPAVVVPSRELLAAHAVAHGFYQHGPAPATYPILKVFDDLAVLGFLDVPDEAFLAGPGRFVSRELTPAALGTILRLGRRLSRGEDVAADDPATSESRLLAHITRGTDDPDYRQGLRLTQVRALFAGPAPLRSFLRELLRAVVLTRDQVDAIYGPPRRWWGYPLRQLMRPADLAVRFIRYALAGRRARRGAPPRLATAASRGTPPG